MIVNRRHSMSMRDIGLYVEYDGKKNVVIGNGEVKEYPIGGMACEFSRLHPTEIKGYIMQLELFNETNLKEHGGEALMQLFELIKADLGSLIATMVMTELSNYLADFTQATEEQLHELIDPENENINEDAVKNFILKDSGFTEFGISNIGQAFLTAYNVFAKTFCGFMVSFQTLVATEGCEQERVDGLLSFYSENIDLQHFDFTIMLYEGAFHSVYTVKSLLSLILFETAHVLDTDTKIVKCKNCGNYFVPVGRSDQIYCGYPAPQDEGKACRDIGAQNTLKKKRKNDDVATEYRRLYMRYKMSIKRHPDDESLKTEFNTFVEDMNTLRKKRDEGLISSDDILEWLAKFE